MSLKVIYPDDRLVGGEGYRFGRAYAYQQGNWKTREARKFSRLFGK